jgi:hypothetical protein
MKSGNSDSAPGDRGKRRDQRSVTEECFAAMTGAMGNEYSTLGDQQGFFSANNSLYFFSVYRCPDF